MKITDISQNIPKGTVELDSIPVNTVFRGRILSWEPIRIYLRDYMGLVDLENGQDIWKGEGCAGIFVTEYEPLEVELLIKGPKGPAKPKGVDWGRVFRGSE